MSEAFTKESDAVDQEPDHAAEEAAHAELAGVKNYITPSGLQRLEDEHRFLASSVSTRSIWIAATSAGCRHWRAR